MNVCLTGKGQEIILKGNHVISFITHLVFGNPHSCFAHIHGKVIYFYAVELFYTYLDGVSQLTQHGLPMVKHTYHLIFQPPQREERFSKEVTATTSRI